MSEGKTSGWEIFFNVLVITFASIGLIFSILKFADFCSAVNIAYERTKIVPRLQAQMDYLNFKIEEIKNPNNDFVVTNDETIWVDQ